MGARQTWKIVGLVCVLLVDRAVWSVHGTAAEQKLQRSDYHVPRERDETLNDGENTYDEWNKLFAENYKDLVDPERAEREAREGEDEVFSGRLEVMEHWPVRPLEGLGQIGGLATCPEGYLHVFHRAGRLFDADSFTDDNVYAHQKDGPIREQTIYKVNASNGIVLDKRGAHSFYLPHGLTIDSAGNNWMTDVAMHQVFKFEPGKTEPSLTLGIPFEPAKSSEDMTRFCKPTGVAIASNGDFFVSDGYCASRIMKFHKSGKFLAQFGVGDFEIAHDIALAEDLDLVCGADREGMRVLCYNAGLKDSSKLGEAEREYIDDELGRVYAIAYSQPDGVLYGVTGQTGVLPSQGFTIDMRDDDHYKTDIIAVWSPEERGFDLPHAVAVSPDGESVYVGEIVEGNPLWKFVKEE